MYVKLCDVIIRQLLEFINLQICLQIFKKLEALLIYTNMSL